MIPKLKDEKSYYDWKGSIENYLHTIGLIKYVETDVTEPEEEAAKACFLRERGAAYQVIWDTTRPASKQIEGRGYKADPSCNPHTLWQAIELTFDKLDDTKAPELLKKLSLMDRASYSLTQEVINDFIFL